MNSYAHEKYNVVEVGDLTFPSPTPRRGLYTYVTWLSKVMAGEHQCHYAGWFKSHYKVQARRDINLDAWSAEHNAMLQDAAREYRQASYEVYIEAQNDLRVRGRGGAILVGKPDLVAIRGDTAVVIDCKTGVPKVSDSLQVRLYMYLIKTWSTHPARCCRRIEGEVRYKRTEEEQMSLPHAAADGVADLIRRYMGIFLDPAPPLPVPSYRECQYCELGKYFCPDQLELDIPTVETDLF